MLPLNPVDMSLELTKSQLKLAQSVHKVLSANIQQGTPSAKDTSGNWNTFKQANTDGILIRVGPHGSSDNTYTWAVAAGTAIVINHGLGRQPIGCHVVNSSKQLSVWIPSTPTDQNISVAPSDQTAYATLYIF